MGDDSGTLNVDSNDPDELTVFVSLAGRGFDPSTGGVDLDIEGFKVKKEVKLQRDHDDDDDGDDGDDDGDDDDDDDDDNDINEDDNDERPEIKWIVTIADDDPDEDTATAMTKMKDKS